MMAPTNTDEIVRGERVTKTYSWNGHQCTPVRGVSWCATRGVVSLLLGPSGSGKTTLLTMMAGLSEPTSGTVRLFGKNVEEYGRHELQFMRAARIGFVFQSFHLIDSLTVLENVALVLRFAGARQKKASRRARQLLQQFHIEHLAGKVPPHLSQGEKQRVAVARAVANDAELIIADEPTASLEARQGMDIIRLLHAYAKEKNRCVVIASHDRRIEEFADVVLHLKDGTLA
jgi:putative ABC transport system ATP-binding protein